MRYKLLGRSGLRVSEVCLGTMTFGEDWGWGASKEESRKIFEAFVEAGGNFIDTANNYTDGTSERYVGEFIAHERDRFVVATKYTLSQRMGDPNAGGNHRKSMVRALEESLIRLNTDYVDLFWLHMWDYTTPVEEILRALDDLVRAGKALHVGISDTPAWVIARANAIADLRGWSRFVALQAEYSLLQRTAERELLPMARDTDMTVLAFAVLEGGELTGKYNRTTAEPKRNDQASERGMALAETLGKLASELGHTPAQVAINWVRQQRGAPIIPILGARTAAQLRDNLGCLEFELTAEQIARLADASPLDAGFPHYFLALPHLRNLIYSGMFEQIDNHHR
jgi:aryl-alcohol dehydrogenase-like predicted oxidoreductase